MAESYQILAQNCPGAASETTVYTVPASSSVVVSTMTICNITSSAATTDVNVRQNGAAVSNAAALMRGVSVAANSTLTLTLGLTLAAADIVSVKPSTGTALTYHLYGTVITP